MTFNYGGIKSNIDVWLDHLLTTSPQYPGLITYESFINFYDNNEILSEKFSLNFTNKETQNETGFDCFFKHNEPNNNLYLLCDIDSFDTFYLSEIKNDIYLTNIHYKFDFTIFRVYDNQPFNRNGKAMIHTIYPNNINLTLEETANVTFYTKNPEELLHLRFNPYSNDLECTQTYNILNCIIPLNHFKNNKTGYYYTYTKDINNEWQILYDSTPINITFSDDDEIVMRVKKINNKNMIKVGMNETELYYVTDYDDTEKNIFNGYNIRHNTSFNGIIKDNNSNQYDATCHLWNPKNEKIRIFCKLNETLKYNEQDIIMDTIKFYYDIYTIIIYFKDYLTVKKEEINIPLIYSDSQTIFYEENKKYYELKFNIKSNYLTNFNSN